VSLFELVDMELLERGGVSKYLRDKFAGELQLLVNWIVETQDMVMDEATIIEKFDAQFTRGDANRFNEVNTELRNAVYAARSKVFGSISRDVTQLKQDNADGMTEEETLGKQLSSACKENQVRRGHLAMLGASMAKMAKRVAIQRQKLARVPAPDHSFATGRRRPRVRRAQAPP
jgi:hypothetical protein